MWGSLSRWLGREPGSDRKGRPARQSRLRLEGLDERAVPGSAAAGVLGTCSTGPAEQVGEFDPSGGAAGGVLG